MTPQREKWLIRIGYVAFGCLCFFGFWLAGFPSDAVEARTRAVLTAATGGGIVQFQEFSASPWGVRAEGVNIVIPPEAPATQATRLRIPVLEIDPKLWSTLFGTPAVRVYAELAGGSIEIDAAADEESREVQIRVRDVDLSQVVKLTGSEVLAVPAGPMGSLGMSATGLISGDVDLTLLPKNREGNRGQIAFQLSSLEMSFGEVMGFKTPALEFEKLNVKLRLAGRSLKIEELTGEGENLELSGEGLVTLNYRSPELSKLAIRFKLKPSAKFFDKTPGVKSLIAMPAVSKYKGKDGAYGIAIAGTAASPKLTPWTR